MEIKLSYKDLATIVENHIAELFDENLSVKATFNTRKGEENVDATVEVVKQKKEE